MWRVIGRQRQDSKYCDWPHIRALTYKCTEHASPVIFLEEQLNRHYNKPPKKVHLSFFPLHPFLTSCITSSTPTLAQSNKEFHIPSWNISSSNPFIPSTHPECEITSQPNLWPWKPVPSPPRHFDTCHPAHAATQHSSLNLKFTLNPSTQHGSIVFALCFTIPHPFFGSVRKKRTRLGEMKSLDERTTGCKEWELSSTHQAWIFFHVYYTQTYNQTAFGSLVILRDWYRSVLLKSLSESMYP